MQSELFKIWLKEQNFKSKGPVYDALFRCRKVERCLKVDLDCEFKKDQCRGVIRRLTYSVADDIAGVDAPAGITIKGNIRTGLASLKGAVVRYVKYKSESLK